MPKTSRKTSVSVWENLSKIADAFPPALVTDPLVTAVTTRKRRRTLFCKGRENIWGLTIICVGVEAGASEKSFSHSCYPAYRREGSLRSEASPFERCVLECKLLKNKHDCGFSGFGEWQPGGSASVLLWFCL